MKATIEIDNDVQDIIIRNRKFFDEPSNDVLKRLLNQIKFVNDHVSKAEQIPSTTRVEGHLVKGVYFPEGFKLRKDIKGKLIEAVVIRGGFLCEGKTFKTPSGAAMHVNGGTAVNGWNFWEYYDETRARWRPLNSLRSN